MSRKLHWGLACTAFWFLSAGQASAQSFDRCQKRINSLTRSFQEQASRAFQYCVDQYRKVDIQYPSPTNPNRIAALESKAVACGKKLGKAIGAPTNGALAGTQSGAGKAEKTYFRLYQLLEKGTCAYDDDQFRLGLLPHNPLNEVWSRWLMMAMLKQAYERQLAAVPEFPEIMAALANPDGNPSNGSCSTKPDGSPLDDGWNYCAVLSAPPCHQLSCRVDTSASVATAQACGESSATENPTLQGAVCVPLLQLSLVYRVRLCRGGHAG